MSTPIWTSSVGKDEQRRHGVAESRQIALLRAHRLTRKVRGTHRYHRSAKDLGDRHGIDLCTKR